MLAGGDCPAGEEKGGKITGLRVSACGSSLSACRVLCFRPLANLTDRGTTVVAGKFMPVSGRAN
jgi:hypothetical protein